MFRTEPFPEPDRPVRITSWRASRLRFLGGAAGHGGFLTLDPSAMGAGNAEVFAIFGDGAARDLNALFAEALGDLLVGERVRGVFIVNHFFDAALERKQRHFAALRPVHGFAEKIAELEDALRRVDIFIGDRAADGGRMHADFFGDFLDHHGLQMIGAVIEEISLAAQESIGRRAEWCACAVRYFSSAGWRR